MSMAEKVALAHARLFLIEFVQIIDIWVCVCVFVLCGLLYM